MDLLDSEQSLESFQSFYCYIKRNLNLILDLDKRSQLIIETIVDKCEQYLRDVNHLGTDDKNERLFQINELFSKVNALTEHTLESANDSHSLITQNMRQLDTHLDQLENIDLSAKKTKRPKNVLTSHKFSMIEKLKTPNNKGLKKRINKMNISIDSNNKANKKVKPFKTHKNVENNRFINSIEIETTIIRSSRSRRTKPIQNNPFLSDNYVFTRFKPRIATNVEKNVINTNGESLEFNSVINSNKSTTDGMIGTNAYESVFCFCKKRSFGPRIQCENEECLIKWFHLECVGIQSKPEDKWFCAKCLENKDYY